MDHLRHLALALLAAAPLAACGPDLASIDPLRSASAFCPVLFDELAKAQARCRPTTAAFDAHRFQVFQQSCQLITAGEAAGRIGYDRATAQACLDSVQSLDCYATGLGAACDHVFGARVPVGGACFDALECTPASAGCFSPTLTCPMTCMAAGSLGSTCTDVDPPCGPGTTCQFGPAGPPTCVTPRGLGDPCGGDACGAGLYCDFSNATCAAQKIGGSPCTSDAECLEVYGGQRQFCDDTLATPVCATVPTSPSSLGQVCGFPRTCARGLTCDFALARPVCSNPLPVGSNCTIFGAACARPSTCIRSAAGASTGTCGVQVSLGGACRPGASECELGAWCPAPSVVAPTSRCTADSTAGGPCGSIGGEQVECVDSYCDYVAGTLAGTCKAWQAVGTTCVAGNECGDGTRADCKLTNAGKLCVGTCRP